jgi:CBS-domain-containing membrane protein
MSDQFQPLASGTLEKGATFHRPYQALPKQVGLDNPALDVMTDLKVVTGITVDTLAPINAAQRRMIQHTVRLLFVVDENDSILGLITATDLLGERPMQFIQTHGGTHSDILVRDIMTPQEKLEVLSMADVQHGRVGNIVATLKATGRQHALVAETVGPNRTQVVRGIFSASQISKQLGIAIHPAEIARTFAEIEAHLLK